MADLLDVLADHPFAPGLSGHHWCPSCQRTLPGVHRGPGTFITDGGLTWSCCLCKRTGTLMQLQSMALGRRDAAMRVLDLLAGDQ